jgi:hypothetical protein
VAEEGSMAAWLIKVERKGNKVIWINPEYMTHVTTGNLGAL